MPTLEQLPQAVTSVDTDLMLIEREGQSYGTTAGAIRAPMQPRLTLATGKLLGRVGIFPGGPEPVSVGTGLVLSGGVLAADGAVVGMRADLAPVAFSGAYADLAGAPGAYVLPPATPSSLGGIKAGNGLTVQADGTAALASVLPTVDGSALAVTATGTASARTLAARMADRLNVRDFGAVGDGVATDTGALQAAIDAAAARPSGGEVFLPPGTYRLNPAVQLLRPKTGVVLRGAGRGRSVIFIDDSAGAIQGDAITNVTGATTWTPLSDFHLRDLTLRGRADVQRTTGAQMLRLFGSNISVENCEFTYSRNMGLVIAYGDEVVVRNCRVFRTVSDGIAVWDVSNAIIEGNEVVGANDDGISAHSGNTTAAPVRSGIVISNNTITESQGVAVLGAKSVTISNNVLRRIMGTGIRVTAPVGVDPQGQTAQFALRITGNLVADVFRRPETNPRNQAQFYIMVTGGLRNAGGGAAPPGEPAPGTGVVTSLYGSGGVGTFYLNNSNAVGVAAPAGYWNEISDNHLVRTLPSVAAVSDWGYGAVGLWVGSNGDGSGFYNGPVSESHMATLGIRIQPALRNCRIARNTIQTSGSHGIWFTTTDTTHELDYEGLTIEGNRIVDFTTAGIGGPPNGTHRVLVRHNEFDGDPRFAAATRGAGGTWTSASGPVGVALANASGFVLAHNAFRNVAACLNLGAGTSNVALGNVIHCDPAAVGFATTNKGVGTVEAAGAGWLHVVETCDPADAAYGRIKAGGVVSAAVAQPSSGAYVAGHFVTANAPTSANRQTLIGWKRLTTGSGHVAGTDWKAVYGTDGAAFAAPKVTAFTASGTWTKDPASVYVEVEVWGAGGAGGNGAVTAPGSAVSGGGGGGGGSKRRGRFRAADLPASVTVTVGTGGVRGGSAGSAGGQGGNSAFGTFLRGFGGGGGSGGSTTASAGGGGGGDNNPGNNASGATAGSGGGFGGGAGTSGAYNPGIATAGMGAGGGGTALGAAGNYGGYSLDGGGGGASGAGVSAANATFNGGAITPFNSAGVKAGGVAPGGSPAPHASFVYGTPASMGGPGGASATVVAGGNGADGQTPAAGGGGGGSTQTGQTHGLGGNGGAGLVLVYEW